MKIIIEVDNVLSIQTRQVSSYNWFSVSCQDNFAMGWDEQFIYELQSDNIIINTTNSFLIAHVLM